MTDDDLPPGVEYALVMPFVVCQTAGGPYEDQAFAAGYHAGLLDKSLEVAAAVGAADLEVTVRSHLIPQLDLIAMRWRFRLIERGSRVEAPGWTSVLFTSREEDER